VTAAVKAHANEVANESIRASATTRASIEQAKGVIAFVLNIDAEEAFGRLRSISNDTNVAVRDVARRIVELARSGGSTEDVVAALTPSRPRPPVG
jgi:AmiR/NasT family two-component response regulator